MKQSYLLIFVLAALVFCSCGTEAGQPLGEPGNPYWNVNNCRRAIPNHVLKKIMLPDHAFSVDSIQGTATETATMEDGTKLTVIHSGCDSYILTFRFEKASTAPVDANIPRKYYEAVGVLAAFEPLNDSPFDIRAAQERFMAYAKNKGAEHALGQTLEIEGGLKGTTSLDKSGQVTEITYTSK